MQLTDVENYLKQFDGSVTVDTLLQNLSGLRTQYKTVLNDKKEEMKKNIGKCFVMQNDDIMFLIRIDNVDYNSPRYVVTDITITDDIIEINDHQYMTINDIDKAKPIDSALFKIFVSSFNNLKNSVNDYTKKETLN